MPASPTVTRTRPRVTTNIDSPGSPSRTIVSADPNSRSTVAPASFACAPGASGAKMSTRAIASSRRAGETSGDGSQGRTYSVWIG